MTRTQIKNQIRGIDLSMSYNNELLKQINPAYNIGVVKELKASNKELLNKKIRYQNMLSLGGK